MYQNIFEYWKLIFWLFTFYFTFYTPYLYTQTYSLYMGTKFTHNLAKIISIPFSHSVNITEIKITIN